MSFVADRTAPTPSQLDGIEGKNELLLRVIGCEWIQQCGMHLQVYVVKCWHCFALTFQQTSPQLCIATGEVLFHRFYFRKSFAKFDVVVSSAWFAFSLRSLAPCNKENGY